MNSGMMSASWYTKFTRSLMDMYRLWSGCMSLHNKRILRGKQWE
jgi:hypothetical protein